MFAKILSAGALAFAPVLGCSPSASESGPAKAGLLCEPVRAEPAIPSTAPPNSTYLAAGKPIPERYKHGPVRARAEFYSPDRINRICAGNKSGLPTCGRIYYACVHGGTMFLPNPSEVPSVDFAETVAHELAHLRGWPATHGD